MRWAALFLLSACTHEQPEDVPGQQVDTWCEAAMGGLSDDSRTDLATLAIAHGGIRAFGVGTVWLDADAALIDAMAPDTGSPEERMSAWADALDEACAVPAEAALVIIDPAGEPVDGVQLWAPYAGTSIHPDTEAIALDLTTNADREALWAMAGAALGEDVVLAERWVRVFDGLAPMVLGGGSVYTTSWSSVEELLPATGTGDLPVFLLTSQRMSPDAALLAGGLRLAGLATIVGYDVHTGLAEASVTSGATTSLLFRGSHLFHDGEPWPDVIRADISTATPSYHYPDLAAMGAPGAVSGPATRPGNVGYVRSLVPPTDLGRGEMRAALMIAHGVFERFYPYFDIVGHHMDEALEDGLAEIDDLDPGDRAGFEHTLGRFMHELYDGHGFYYDALGQLPDGYLDVQIQSIDLVPVIRYSDHVDLLAGDTIVAVDGTPADEWYAEAMGRRSAASDGYRFDLATRELKQVFGTRTLTVLRDDAEYVVTPTPQPFDEAFDSPWGGTLRPTGYLDDLGAPSLYFLNLGQAANPSDASIASSLNMLDADGLIVDMRDYPGTFNHYSAARWLNPEPFVSAIFEIPEWTGPDRFGTYAEQYDLTPNAGAWDGPMVWLVSNKSVSASENFAQMVVFQDHVTVVGQQSASTNGNITAVWLAGGFYTLFTGMRVLNPDGSVLHGTGIVPDIEVAPLPSEFAAGDDPELLEAIAVLTAGDR